MVAYYEGETDYPPAGILPDLARVLGVTTDQLLGVKPVRSRTKKPQDTRLWRRFKQVEKLPAKERRREEIEEWHPGRPEIRDAQDRIADAKPGWGASS